MTHTKETLDRLSAAATQSLSYLPIYKEARKRMIAAMTGADLDEHIAAVTTEHVIAYLHRTGQLVAVSDDAIERYRHVKRGTVYEVVGEAELQTNADNLVDGSQMMVYRGDDGKLWCRHYDEFHDGRFAALAAKGTGDE